MKLSRPVVVQHHGHLTFTLDFQGQIFKMLYLRNVRADCHGAKGMWVDRILDPHCDFELWPHPSWPLIFKVKFWKSRNSGMLDPHCDFEVWPHPWTWPLILRSNFEKVVTQELNTRLTRNERDVGRLNVGPTLWLSTLTSLMTLTLNFQWQILK